MRKLLTRQLTVKGVRFEFVRIPPGRTIRGDRDLDAPHVVDMPQETVVGRRPVSRAQYRAVAQAAGLPMPPQATAEPSDFPMTGVDYATAREFAAAVAYGARRPVRLITETEWEYVARGWLVPVPRARNGDLSAAALRAQLVGGSLLLEHLSVQEGETLRLVRPHSEPVDSLVEAWRTGRLLGVRRFATPTGFLRPGGWMPLGSDHWVWSEPGAKRPVAASTGVEWMLGDHLEWVLDRFLPYQPTGDLPLVAPVAYDDTPIEKHAYGYRGGPGAGRLPQAAGVRHGMASWVGMNVSRHAIRLAIGPIDAAASVSPVAVRVRPLRLPARGPERKQPLTAHQRALCEILRAGSRRAPEMQPALQEAGVPVHRLRELVHALVAGCVVAAQTVEYRGRPVYRLTLTAHGRRLLNGEVGGE